MEKVLYALSYYGRTGAGAEIFRYKEDLEYEFKKMLDKVSKNNINSVNTSCKNVSDFDPSMKAVYGITIVNVDEGICFVCWLSGSYELVKGHFLDLTGKKNVDETTAYLDSGLTIISLSKFDLN